MYSICGLNKMTPILYSAVCYVLFCGSHVNAEGISIKIDGLVDMGRKWNYRYEVQGDKTTKSKKLNKNKGLKTIDILTKYKDKSELDMVTQIVGRADEEAPDIYVKPIKVKDDLKIREFTKHVYEQTVKVFDSIKDKMTNYDMKREVDFLARSYEDKFGEFVRETQEQKVKTRLGRQKVILNTVDTSNQILNRLVNYLMLKMEKKGVLRYNMAAANVFQNELNRKVELENQHICTKFQICRSRNSFTRYLADCITIVLSANDRKVKEFTDALTEVLKNTDSSNTLDAETERKYMKGIADFEKYDASMIKPILYIVKNIITFKNNPIKVVGEGDIRINKTTSLLEVMNMFDSKLSPNEENELVWRDIQTSLQDWKDGKRNDVLDITQSMVDNMKKGVDGLNNEEKKAFQRNVRVMLTRRVLYI